MINAAEAVVWINRDTKEIMIRSHSDGVRGAAHANARAVNHDVAFTRFDEAVVHQDLTGALHLLFEARRATDERPRRDAPIQGQAAQRAVVRGERQDGRGRACLRDEPRREPRFRQRDDKLGADLACDAVMAEAIRAIGGDFGVDHGAVRTIFDAGNVISRKREARGELFRRRGDGDEVWKPAVEDLHDGRPPECSWPR